MSVPLSSVRDCVSGRPGLIGTTDCGWLRRILFKFADQSGKISGQFGPTTDDQSVGDFGQGISRLGDSADHWSVWSIIAKQGGQTLPENPRAIGECPGMTRGAGQLVILG
ncbi:hypothetical protein RRG08_059156 [Elysia crispata]|uniref:Uncharacterized protein n=1 Tax=Elysia crispata TaxID=231223 RepID=A0AAE1DMT7_9GAST|nr:hypothetical protein RRG08_059156 [Elysia crispata]